MTYHKPAAGGLAAPCSTYRAVWCVDFEFRADPGERPYPICMVARELKSGHEFRLWRGDLLQHAHAPFDVGPDSLFVAFFASAEIGCFLELGWPVPTNILDLYAEHRVLTNGRPTLGNSLIHALAFRGISAIDADLKDRMRDLIVTQWSWSADQQREILDYCAADVQATSTLFQAIKGVIDLPRALLRGRYTAACAKMERAGVPVDQGLFERLSSAWPDLRKQLIADVDADFGVYDGDVFKHDRFLRWLSARRIPWPRLPSGRLDLSLDAFRDQAKRWPEVLNLRELRATLGKMQLSGLHVGSDGRNRCLLSPFSAVTGRNQPSTSKFIFGPARWMRGLIRPPEGYGIALIDYTAQEIGIAAALSGDEAMIAAYQSGDPYLEFAKQAGLAPQDATKETHAALRERCKQVVLGVNYGMGAQSMADRAGISPIEAEGLLQRHRETYHRFWGWAQATIDTALLKNRIESVFGWCRQIGYEPNPRSIMNFPMQANGAEMMRIAAIASTEAGIEVCAPIHDAFLIAAPLEQLDDHNEQMRFLMSRAGASVTGGLPIETESKVFRFPDRFVDERVTAMWDRVMGLLDRDSSGAAA